MAGDAAVDEAFMMNAFLTLEDTLKALCFQTVRKTTLPPERDRSTVSAV
jgi:hypothetical protein